MPLLIVTAIYFGVYVLLRLPTSYLPLAYYDDGETLYQTLVLLKGGVLYRDSISHHFLGYILPFYSLAQITGFSLDLIREVALINQILTALGIYILVAKLRSKSTAFIAGLICLTAREPSVLGFSPFYQMNLLLVFITLCATLSFSKERNIYLASFLAGIALTFDQRTICFSIIPAIALLIQNRLVLIPRIVLAYLIAPIFALLFLWQSDAIIPFIEQSWTFPREYRVGSTSLQEMIHIGLANFRYLITLTPLLCACAIAGYWGVIRIRNRETNPTQIKIYTFLLLIPIALLPIPFLSGRDFDYYSLNWIPYMAIVASLGMAWFTQGVRVVRFIFPVALLTPPILSLILTTSFLRDPKVTEYQGDGIREVGAFLESNLTESDTFYLWGYRLELYARLERLAPNPFANPLMIHPDSQVVGADREKHIFTPYSERFISDIKAHPPSYIVTFDRDDRTSKADSPAKQALFSLIAEEYEEVYQISRKDFLSADCNWRVFKRSVGNKSS